LPTKEEEATEVEVVVEDVVVDLEVVVVVVVVEEIAARTMTEDHHHHHPVVGTWMTDSMTIASEVEEMIGDTMTEAEITMIIDVVGPHLVSVFFFLLSSFLLFECAVAFIFLLLNPRKQTNKLKLTLCFFLIIKFIIYFIIGQEVDSVDAVDLVADLLHAVTTTIGERDRFHAIMIVANDLHHVIAVIVHLHLEQ